MIIKPEDFITDEKTNSVFLSTLLPKESSGFPKEARKNLIEALKNYFQDKGIHYEELVNTRDVWCRDYMPLQITKNLFLSYTYNPDYLNDDKYYITNWELHKVYSRKSDICRIPHQFLPLILDGGNVIKALNKKGKPTCILCNKVLNENNVSEVELEDWWKEYFEDSLELVLLPWEGPEYNPIGHADGIVRYISKGKVLMTNYSDYDKKYAEKYRKILESHGFFEVQELEYSKSFSEDDKLWKMLKQHSWSYINFLQVGNNILLPKLGYDKLDSMALEQVTKHFGDGFDVEIIDCDMTEIIGGDGNGSNSGGALNCLTWTISKPWTSLRNSKR